MSALQMDKLIHELTKLILTITEFHARKTRFCEPPLSSPRAHSLDVATPGGVVSFPPQWDHSSLPSIVQLCRFCSSRDHFIRHCPVALQYIQQGKIVRNRKGRFTLPGGCYPDCDIPSRDLQKRVNNYWAPQDTLGARCPGNQWEHLGYIAGSGSFSPQCIHQSHLGYIQNVTSTCARHVSTK